MNFADWGITLLAMSGHKLYAPQGIGALIRKTDHPLELILFGGGQQQGLRPGTLNLPGIVGLGEACHLRQLEMEADEKAIAAKRDYLQTQLIQAILKLLLMVTSTNVLPETCISLFQGFPIAHHCPYPSAVSYINRISLFQWHSHPIPCFESNESIK